MKTEKRPAKVGEKILITEAYPIYKVDTYYAGDIFTVAEVDVYDVGDVRVLGVRTHFKYEEYEVIIENGGGIIEKMQAEIDELKAKVGALEKREYGNAKPFEFEGVGSIPYYRKLNKSPQARRDEIVAQAKADVEALQVGRGQYHAIRYSNVFSPWSCYAEFITNNEKRTVVALLKDYRNGKVRAKGIAKCAPDDCFNSHIGRAIALRRALGLPVPSEYLNVPQPTEVRVGDVVRGYTSGIYTVKRFCDEEIGISEYGRPFRFNEGCGWLGTNQVKIIDDSREKEAQ